MDVCERVRNIVEEIAEIRHKELMDEIEKIKKVHEETKK